MAIIKSIEVCVARVPASKASVSATSATRPGRSSGSPSSNCSGRC
ncbi:Uncharacterised protein [Bordetella pertussis]|nr:Uncharacterised protein [Bordetella pertussis]